MILRTKLVLSFAFVALPAALCSCGSSSDASNDPAANDAGQPDAVQTDGGQPEGGDAESDAFQPDSGESDASKNDGGLLRAEYPAAMAAAICDNIGACCTAHGYQNNTTTCHDHVLGIYQDLMDAVALSDGVTYDAKAAATCVEGQKAYVIKCVPDQGDIDELNAACSKVVVGATQNGQPCTNSFQCAGAATGSSVCNDESDLDGGSYQQCEQASGTLPHGSLGATCGESCRFMTGSHATCDRVGDYVEAKATCWAEDGLRCDLATHQCVAVRPVGQSCSSDTDCEASAYCESDVCTELVADGQPCDPDGPIQCTSHSYCDGNSTICTPNKKTGDACSDSLECESWQCHGGKCQPANIIAPYLCIES